MKALQRGFNLISLMVGVSISLISILAMLSLYKNMIGVSVTSIQDAKQDGQIAAALLTAQRELLNAGFREPDSVLSAARIVLIRGAALTSGILTGAQQTLSTTGSVSGNAMIWIYKPTSTSAETCVGLLVQNGALSRLQATGSCTSITLWSTLSWTSTTLIEAKQAPADTGSNQIPLFFDAQYVSCWPFGKAQVATTPLKYLQVTMNATTSTLDLSSTTQPAYVKNVSNVCLPNIPAP